MYVLWALRFPWPFIFCGRLDISCLTIPTLFFMPILMYTYYIVFHSCNFYIFISHICCSFSLTAVVQISAPQTTATFCHLIYIHTLNENARLLAYFLLFFFYPSAMCLFLKFWMLSSTHPYPFQIFITFLTFLLLTHPLYKILPLHWPPITLQIALNFKRFSLIC